MNKNIISSLKYIGLLLVIRKICRAQEMIIVETYNICPKFLPSKTTVVFLFAFLSLDRSLKLLIIKIESINNPKIMLNIII